MDKFQFDDGAIFAFLSYDDRTGAAIDHSFIILLLPRLR